MTEIVLGLGLIAGIYMAWNIGANDIANGMASPVAARALTLRQAVFLGGILDFVGATFIGSHVTSTISKDIVRTEFISDPHTVAIGLLAALFAAAFWVFMATWKQLPVSTTHSIVGAIVGFGFAAGGMKAVQWAHLIPIVASWIISPLFAGVLTYLIFLLIRSRILSRKESFLEALRWTPFFAGITFFVVFVSLLTKTPLGNKLHIGFWESVTFSFVVSLALGFIAKQLMKRVIAATEEEKIEHIFRRLQIFTACYVCLAHGANDVANAIGPLAGIYFIYQYHSIATTADVPWFLLAGGGVFIALGVFTWGYRVIETIGHKITVLNNTRGFAVDFGTATSVLIASKLGLPVSTTHAAVGSVIGVGLSGGLGAVDFRVVWNITVYWIISLPLSAIPTIVLYHLFRWLLPA